MARKKVVKPAKAKKTVKRQTKMAVTNLIDKMEHGFKGMPAQLIAQCRKDLATQQQQEKKLAIELKKASALSKAIKEKCAFLAKSKMTAPVKKQLTAAKQGQDKANQAIKAMTTNIDQLKQQINALLAKQAKFIALDKEISKFDKQWRAPVKKEVKARKKIKRIEKAEPIVTTEEIVQTEVQTQEPVDTTTY